MLKTVVKFRSFVFCYPNRKTFCFSIEMVTILKYSFLPFLHWTDRFDYDKETEIIACFKRFNWDNEKIKNLRLNILSYCHAVKEMESEDKLNVIHFISIFKPHILTVIAVGSKHPWYMFVWPSKLSSNSKTIYS